MWWWKGKTFDDFLQELWYGDKHIAMNTNAQLVYNEAKSCLGKHITLDSNVPAELGCAEAVSYVLKNSGVVGMPVRGIAGTAALYDWLKQNTAFEQITDPELGAIIISPTGLGNGKTRGHVGVVGGLGVHYPGDYGVLSNDSNTGYFLELWSVNRWRQFYQAYGGLPLAYFRAK